MAIRVTCPGCQAAYTCPDDYRGKKLKCKKCQQVFLAGSSQPAARPRLAAPPPREEFEEMTAPPTAKRLPADVPKRSLAVPIAVGVGALVVASALSFAAYQFLKSPPNDPLIGKGPGPGTKDAGNSDEDQGTFKLKAPPRNDLDLAFVAADFNAAVVLHPQRSLKSPLLAPLLKDLPLGQAVEATGIDPQQIERIVLFLEPMPGGNAGFFGCGIVRFAQDVDGKQLITKNVMGVQEATYQGKTYLKSTDPALMMAKVPMAAHVADARTLVLGPEPTLHKMLAAKDVNSPLTERLRTVDLSADVAGVFLLEPFRPVLAQTLDAAKDEIPEALAGVQALPEQLVAAHFALNLSGDNLLRINLETKDAAAAGSVHKLAVEALGFGKQLYPHMREDLSKQMPPDLGKLVFGVVDELFANLALSKDGKMVSLDVKTPQGLAELPAKLGPMLAQLLDVPKKEGHEQAVDWVRENNAFGPQDKIVTDMANHLRKEADAGSGFFIRLGPKLVKSGRQTWLCTLRDDLFVFALTPEQEKLAPFKDLETVIITLTRSDDMGQAKDVVLGPPVFEKADSLDQGQKITGAVPFTPTRPNPDKQFLALRLYVVNRGLASYQHLGEYLPADKKALPFTFPSPKELGIQQTGPHLVVLELVTFFGPERRGKTLTLGNSVAVLLNIAPK